jgi:glycine hydroxymethyltransferase
LAEMMEYGEAYARQIQVNSGTLGAELDNLGFNVMGKAGGYSLSHQVLVNIRGCGFGDIEKRFHDSNILLPVTTIMGDELAGTRSGLRISVQEATRQGMNEKEMRQVAAFIRRVADGEGGDSLWREVEEFVEPYRELQYCFPI